MIDNAVLNGIGSLQYTGTSILMSQPETGALITEYASERRREPDASARLRRTGHEDDREVHLALNSGIPLVDPTGGFFFVFQTGEPVFRKYDARGQLRVRAAHPGTRDRSARRQPADHVAEAADRAKASCRWSRRRSAPPRSIAPAICGSRSSCPTPTCTTATATRSRTVQFRAAGIIAPNSLFFGKNGRVLVTPGLYEFESPALERS